MNPAHVLVIAPHPDDEVLGCGGAIRLRVQQGQRVFAVFLTSGELGLQRLPVDKARNVREAEARRAGRILGLSQLIFLRQPDWVLAAHLKKAAAGLRKVLRELKPSVIYLPHPADNHPDHRATWPLLQMAMPVRLALSVELLAYEVWSPIPEPDTLVDITSVMKRKLRAMRAHRSQLADFNYIRAVTALNQFRGALGAKCDFAEAFVHLSIG